MTFDVVNEQNQKVGSVDLPDEVFGGPVKTALIWEQVVQQQASARRGTHATKTRGEVSGTGKKPWRQKGTGRARVGEARNPLWRKGGTVFGPQPRDYAYDIPKKVTRGALREALAQKMQEGALTVVDQLTLTEPKTKQAVELLTRLGIVKKAVIVDVAPHESIVRSARNLPGIRVVPAARLTAHDVADAVQVLVTQAALERLQQVLS
jgi:large subunit ribosomal protein L4